MNLIEHAQNEFSILGWPGDCEMQQAICRDLLELLQAFSDQGHSGFSASYLLNLFDKLARFQTISPLTGNDDEWRCIGDNMYQNKRDTEVFKEGKEAYWTHGIIFRDPDGSTFTSADSHVPIEFPWTRPEPEIRDMKYDPDDQRC